MIERVLSWLTVFILLAVGHFVVQAQSTCALSGSVTDPNGALIERAYKYKGSRFNRQTVRLHLKNGYRCNKIEHWSMGGNTSDGQNVRSIGYCTTF